MDLIELSNGVRVVEIEADERDGSWWMPVAEAAETAGLEVRAQWGDDDPSQIERVRVVGGTAAEAERAAMRAVEAYGTTTYTLTVAVGDGERVYTVVSAPPWAEASS